MTLTELKSTLGLLHPTNFLAFRFALAIVSVVLCWVAIRVLVTFIHDEQKTGHKI